MPELIFRMEDGQDPTYESDIYIAKHEDPNRYFEADWVKAVCQVKSQLPDAEWGETEIHSALSEMGWGITKHDVHWVSY